MPPHRLSSLLVMLLVANRALAETPENSQAGAQQHSIVAVTAGDTARFSLKPPAHKQPGSGSHELTGGDRPGDPQPGEHPLLPALRWARSLLPAMEKLQDYSATLVVRERIDGKLGKSQAFLLRIRHQPFSVYMRGLGPAAIKGEEALFVEGKNNGKLWARAAGLASLMPTLSIDPKGSLAMSNQRYPITDIGILNLGRHMIAIAESEVRHDECQVAYFSGGKINGRACSWCQVVHPARRPYFQFNVARIFVDDQWKIPFRYEAFDWPSEPGGLPELVEEYTYLDLKFNNGFRDEDFSIDNPAYHFR
jgi:hypothetical protein